MNKPLSRRSATIAEVSSKLGDNGQPIADVTDIIREFEFALRPLMPTRGSMPRTCQRRLEASGRRLAIAAAWHWRRVSALRQSPPKRPGLTWPIQLVLKFA
ncbi:MAG: hypothetical protein M3N02_10065 [Pseudomonadota bacterium]|nr:hypothetical protein [Pseudomonadota bacterium]